MQWRHDKISEADFSLYKKKLDKSKYEILRNPTQISWIAISASQNNLDPENYQFIGEENMNGVS